MLGSGVKNVPMPREQLPKFFASISLFEAIFGRFGHNPSCQHMYSDARKDLQKINVYTFILGILL